LKTHSIYDGDGRLITDDVRSNFETRLKIVNASNRYNQSNTWLYEIDNTSINVDQSSINLVHMFKSMIWVKPCMIHYSGRSYNMFKNSTDRRFDRGSEQYL